MSKIRLIDIELPSFGVPLTQPRLPASTYADRLGRLRNAADALGLNVVIIYADREHFANMAYLIGFEPRFEEALLIVSGSKTPVLITGPENQGYSAIAQVDLERVLYPPFGLLGQDRRSTPPLANLFYEYGIAQGMRVGIAGWKFYGPSETATPDEWLETPSFIVDTLRVIVGTTGRVVNATRLLMDASDGLRAINEIDQLAQFEFAACHASEAVKRVLLGVKPGMPEYDAARLLEPFGLPLSCHPMLASGDRAFLGLAGPSDQIIQHGRPFAVALGVWGALCCRAGWLVEEAGDLPAGSADYLERLAIPYFACVADWYETVGIGVTGGEIDATVGHHLGDPFFRLALNPGHLIHLDEWMNSPIYPGSSEQLQSGQAFQVDIIPATNSAYFSINIEDGIALLDDRGRAEFAERWPEAWGRIELRRAFMADVLGIRIKPEVLPFSNLAAALPPFMLAPSRVLARS